MFLSISFYLLLYIYGKYIMLFFYAFNIRFVSTGTVNDETLIKCCINFDHSIDI